MTNAAAVVAAQYEAYSEGDLAGVLDLLAEDFVCAAYRGPVWTNGPAAARKLYERNMAAYPMALTEVLGVIALGDCVIKRERSRSALPGVPDVEALAIYTVRDGRIARLDMATRPSAEGRAEALAERQLRAYNVQDLDAFCACYSEDITVSDYNGAVSSAGMEAFRARYRDLFATFPENRVKLRSRLALGDLAVDHEEVMRSASAQMFEVVAIYSVRGEKIAHVDFIR